MGDLRGFGDGSLTPFVDAIWTATTPIRFAATWQPHVMSVVCLPAARVLLHSPCRPSNALYDAIAQLGTVSDVIAPNWFHDLYLDAYRARYPDATFWAPAFLKRQRPALIDRVLDSGTPAPWSGLLPSVRVAGLLTFDERIFYHVPTRTLIVADLLMNARATPDTPFFTKLGYRLFRLDGSLRVFPVLAWFGQSRRPAVRAAVRQIFEWNPERLIVGHGTPIAHGAAAQLRAALGSLA